MNMKRGDICRTPFEPSGLAMVLDIWDRAYPEEDAIAIIVYLEDHPHGYLRGSQGQYLAKELRQVEAKILESESIKEEKPHELH